MTLIQGQSCLCQERTSVALLYFFLPHKSEFCKQSARFSRLAIVTDVPKYIKNDLQRILKTVLEAWTPASVPAPAPATSQKFEDKLLKARFLDVYCGKSHIDCYNFCQHYEDYFATAEATKANGIFSTTSFFQDRISFCWQQYKRRQDVDNSVPITQNKFKAFFH